MANTLKPEVKAVLEAAATNVTYQRPQTWAVMPAVSWSETANREAEQVDGLEYTTEFAYSIDIWGSSQSQVDGVFDLIDTGMRALGFRREFAQDLPDPSDVRHKTTRYRAYLVKDKIYP